MLKKEYGFQFRFAGGGVSAGLMQCPVCNKPVKRKHHDWLLSKKTVDIDDWAYVTRHRKCVKDQSGWEKIEKERIKFNLDVECAVTALNEIYNQFGEEVLVAAFESGKFRRIFDGILEQTR